MTIYTANYNIFNVNINYFNKYGFKVFQGFPNSVKGWWGFCPSGGESEILLEGGFFYQVKGT